MRTSAIAALTLALPLLAVGGTDVANAGGWCDRPAAYYGAPVGYGNGYGYGYGYGRPYGYRYGYEPRVVGYGPPVGYYGAAPFGFRADWGWRRRGLFGFGW